MDLFLLGISYLNILIVWSNFDVLLFLILYKNVRVGISGAEVATGTKPLRPHPTKGGWCITDYLTYDWYVDYIMLLRPLVCPLPTNDVASPPGLPSCVDTPGNEATNDVMVDLQWTYMSVCFTHATDINEQLCVREFC